MASRDHHLEPSGSRQRRQRYSGDHFPGSQVLSSAPSREHLRTLIRAQRRALTPQQRRRAAQALLRHLHRKPVFLRAHRIAGYLPVGGEIDPRPLLQFAQHLGKTVYLPVLHGPQLRFAPWGSAERPLQANRYGIPEPSRSRGGDLDAQAMDLILMPLVAFDARGHRLGMGGGYYDRTLARQRKRQPMIRPVLLGLAYSFQQVSSLTAERWDVSVAGVATDRGLIAARSTSRRPPA